MSQRFKTLIVIALAFTMAVCGYTFTNLEGALHTQHTQLVETRQNNCKLKLYDLVIGYEGHAVHMQKGSPQYNPHQAEIIEGALKVVLSIPSAQECIPVLKESISTQSKQLKLSPKVEKELIQLAIGQPVSTSTRVVNAHSRTRSPTGHRKPSQKRTGVGVGKGPKAPPKAPTPSPAPPAGHSGSSTPAPSTPTRTTPTKTPTVTTPSTPPVKTPPVTTPSVEVPPVTVPSVEVPPITTPPIEVPPVKVPSIELPPIKLPEIKLPKL
jgi:hypothetical protein